MTTRTSILSEADRATSGQRDVQYGSPEDNFRRIAALWTEYISIASGKSVFISPENVAWMMILLKAARSVHSFNPDNYIDAAGYAACAGEIAATFALGAERE